MIYFTSDLHLMHDREFLYKPRGFNSIYEMNDAILQRWNETVNPDDEVYILGDLMLNDNSAAMNYLNKMNGWWHIILGNHDTDSRIELYRTLPQVLSISYAEVIKYNKYRFYLAHCPTLCANLDESHFSQHTLDLFGHTHSKSKFYNDNPFMYNVAMDAHDCRPVSIEQALEDMKIKYKECGDML